MALPRWARRLVVASLAGTLVLLTLYAPAFVLDAVSDADAATPNGARAAGAASLALGRNVRHPSGEPEGESGADGLGAEDSSLASANKRDVGEEDDEVGGRGSGSIAPI